MTREEAIAKARTGWWKSATPREIVQFQLYEELMCMDFGDFQQAVEQVLGRPVWTHEFAHPDDLRAEFEGRKAQRSAAESIGMLADMVGPERVIVVDPAEKERRS